MKRRIRKRRVLKWVGVGICVGVCAMWITGNFRLTFLTNGYWGYAVTADDFVCWHRNAPFPLYAPFTRTTARFPRWPEFDRFGHSSIVFVPYWVLLIPTALATLWLWRWDRRPKSGCVNCGYNLTGNVSGVCPECGTAIGIGDSASEGRSA